MPIRSETHPTPPPTIQARSSAELRKTSVRYWLASFVLTTLVWVVMLPDLWVQLALVWLLGAFVTWAALRVR